MPFGLLTIRRYEERTNEIGNQKKKKIHCFFVNYKKKNLKSKRGNEGGKIGANFYDN